MKKLYSTLCVLLCAACMITMQKTSAQCLVGYTQSQLNWDYLDFLPSNDATNYTPFYVAGITSYNQNFSMGTRRINFTSAPSANITLNGENYTNTGDAGSFATPGSDVQFTTTNVANTTITMALDSEVMNIRYSLFDIDNGQRVTITAFNALGVGQAVTVVKANLASGIAIVGAQATGPGLDYINSDNRGAINIGIVGPVSESS